MIFFERHIVKHLPLCNSLLVCDECGRKHKDETGYWGYYGSKFCCPICLNKHYKKEMER